MPWTKKDQDYFLKELDKYEIAVNAITKGDEAAYKKVFKILAKIKDQIRYSRTQLKGVYLEDELGLKKEASTYFYELCTGLDAMYHEVSDVYAGTRDPKDPGRVERDFEKHKKEFSQLIEEFKKAVNQVNVK